MQNWLCCSGPVLRDQATLQAQHGKEVVGMWPIFEHLLQGHRLPMRLPISVVPLAVHKAYSIALWGGSVHPYVLSAPPQKWDLTEQLALLTKYDWALSQYQFNSTKLLFYSFNTELLYHGVWTWDMFITNRALGNSQKYNVGPAKMERCSLNWRSVF